MPVGPVHAIDLVNNSKREDEPPVIAIFDGSDSEDTSDGDLLGSSAESSLVSEKRMSVCPRDDFIARIKGGGGSGSPLVLSNESESDDDDESESDDNDDIESDDDGDSCTQFSAQNNKTVRLPVSHNCTMTGCDDKKPPFQLPSDTSMDLSSDESDRGESDDGIPFASRVIKRKRVVFSDDEGSCASSPAKKIASAKFVTPIGHRQPLNSSLEAPLNYNVPCDMSKLNPTKQSGQFVTPGPADTTNLYDECECDGYLSSESNEIPIDQDEELDKHRTSEASDWVEGQSTDDSSVPNLCDSYETFLNNMAVMGCSGLDQYTSSEACFDYVCGYAIKDNLSSKMWMDKFKAIATAAEKDTPMQKILSKFCREITKLRSIPRDEAMFTLGGGQYTLSSMNFKSCSLNSVDLNGISNTDHNGNSSGGGTGKSFNKTTLVNMYKTYVRELKPFETHFNFYRFAASKFKCVPHFFGYQSIPSWPLQEEFSKWMLFLYIPHSGEKISDMQINGSYAARLEQELTHEQFPSNILARLIRLKHKHTRKVTETERIDNGGGDDNSPTIERINPNLQVAADVADGVLGDEVVPDGNELDFESMILPDPDPSIVWNHSYQERGETFLNDLKDKYYNSTEEATDTEGLNQPDLYSPTNANNEGQMLAVASFLLHIKDWLHYFEYLRDFPNATEDEVRSKLPKCIRVYIQGNPGTGKSFIIHTVSNMCLRLLKSVDQVLKMAPTGCASALINGKTINRGLYIPCGRKLLGKPETTTTGTTHQTAKFIKMMKALVVMITDEHSMENRSVWAWKEHNCAVFRENLEHPNPPCLEKRSYGGIPYVYSVGDIDQLPPVTGKSHSNAKIGVGQSSDALGRRTFNEFLCPPDGDSETGYTFILDEVIRQTDPIYRGVIERMRLGDMNRDSCDFIMKRKLINLPPDERKLFEQDGIYVVPRWKDAKPIVQQYLIDLDQPIAKCGCTKGTGRVNHIDEECRLPRTNAFAKGALVMLQCNFIVEYNLFNGSVGKVVDVVYKNEDGPASSVMPSYVLVDFPDCNIPADDVFDPSNPTHVPIPIHTVRCEKKCCSMTSIPLRVCKAITIHKCQGMSVGTGELWNRIIVMLPGLKSKMRQPGLEYVACSRAKDVKCMAFIESEAHPLTYERLMKVGRTPAYEERRSFVSGRLKESADRTKAIISQALIDIAPDGDKSITAGYWELVQWYLSYTNSVH